MKVIFIGLHNKPETMPLCGSTKTGKIINRIIRDGGLTDFSRTNLFDVDYYPYSDEEKRLLALDWWDRVDPADATVLVLLGAVVQDCFRYDLVIAQGVVKVAHPASCYGEKKIAVYVKQTIDKINEAIKEQGSSKA